MDIKNTEDRAGFTNSKEPISPRPEVKLEPGIYIMHPLHGIGFVENFEEKEVLGQKCKFAIISFQGDKLKMTINLNQKDNLVRNLICPEKVAEILSYIKNFESDYPIKSSDRYNLNMKKIKSLDIIMLAQVIKDLTVLGKVKKLTPKELAMLKQSKKTMASEFSFVSSTPIEDAEAMIDESCYIK